MQHAREKLEHALRLQADGSWKEATLPDAIGLMYRPIVTQISRWDKLKGWMTLLEGFKLLVQNKAVLSKKAMEADGFHSQRHGRRLQMLRLVRRLNSFDNSYSCPLMRCLFHLRFWLDLIPSRFLMIQKARRY